MDRIEQHHLQHARMQQLHRQYRQALRTKNFTMLEQAKRELFTQSGSVNCTNNPTLPANPTTHIGFNGATRVDGGGGVYWQVETADLNGDGKADMVTIADIYNCTTNTWTESMSVVLSQGAAGFAPAVLIEPAGFTSIYNFVVGDVNGDGKQDIVVDGNGGFMTLLGNGDGTFTQSAVSSGADMEWRSQLIDVDGDGKVDLIGVSGSSLYWSKGNGDGTFQSYQSVSLPFSFSNGMLADVNKDGILDVIGDGYDSTNSVYTAATVLGTGSLTFSGTANIATGNSNVDTCDFAVGDVDGTGFPSLVTADCSRHTVTLFKNNGDGTLAAGNSIFAPYYPEGVTIADVNGDGKGDILFSTDDSSTLGVMLSNNGSFTSPAVGYPIGGYPFAYPAVADFDGDGMMDVAVPDDDTATIAVFHGFGDGTFKSNTTFWAPKVTDTSGIPIDYWSWQASAGDVNGDGLTDFVATGCCNYSGPVPQLIVYTANGDGTFTSAGYEDPNTSIRRDVESVTLGDFNGDGKMDAAMNDYNNGDLMVFLNAGNGTFNAPVITSAGSNSNYYIKSGDFNGDGKVDVATMKYNGTVNVYTGNGDGTFNATPVVLPAGSSNYTYALNVGDVNKDGKLDIVTASSSCCSGGSQVSVYLGNGDGTFQAPVEYSSTGGADDVVIGDVNGDGWPDVMTVEDGGYPKGDEIGVLLNNGDGTFGTAVAYPTSSVNENLDCACTEFATLADINGDGKVDIVASNSEIGASTILYGVGDGTFFAPVESPIGEYDSGIAAADVNQDGAIDAMTAGDDYPGMTVSLNAGGAKAALASSANPSFTGQPVTLTATITPSLRGVTAVPAGSVSFYDGTSLLGTGNVSGGAATYTTSSLALGNHSITAVYSGDAVNFVSGATAFLNQGISSPPIGTVTSLSPASTTAGSSGLTLQVNGSNFVSGSVVQWNNAALTTTFVSSTQLKATVPGTDLASVGTASITVLNPGTSGGTSNAVTFAINTAASKSTFSATITGSQTVPQGSTATYTVNVTFAGNPVALTAKCYNLPTGAACSYTNSTHTLNITTSSTTPKGTWNIVVVFTPATNASLWLSSALAALLPFGLLAGGKLRRRKLVALAVLGLVLMLALGGCASSFNSSNVQPQQSSATAVLNVI